MKELDIIQTFEKDFIEAGKLAENLQKGAKTSQKLSSGIRDVDIVTSADLIVQEFVLKMLVKSALRNCQVVAEEDTPSRKLFAKESDFVITLDPIDGTRRYAEARDVYSIIVTLHDKKRPLYTFNYFPRLNWGIKIVEDKIELFGKTPDKLNSFPEKTIVYSNHHGNGNPEVEISELYSKLVAKGYKFVRPEGLNKEYGARFVFLTGKSDGFFTKGDGSAVDCLTVLHYALAKGYKVYDDIDLSKTEKKESCGSAEYRGYYLVLK